MEIEEDVYSNLETLLVLLCLKLARHLQTCKKNCKNWSKMWSKQWVSRRKDKGAFQLCRVLETEDIPSFAVFSYVAPEQNYRWHLLSDVKTLIAGTASLQWSGWSLWAMLLWIYVWKRGKLAKLHQTKTNKAWTCWSWPNISRHSKTNADSRGTPNICVCLFVLDC